MTGTVGAGRSRRERVALVTGSTRNLGMRIATELAADGYDVVVHGPTLDEAQSAADELRALDPVGVVDAVGFDLGNRREIDAGFAELADRGRLPDALVNNAAHLGLTRTPFIDQGPDFFREVFEVNFFGVLGCCQLAGAHMADRGGGAIVNISSLAGTRAIHGRAAYSASKAAVDGLTRALALDLGPLGVRVNAIAPGYVWTPRWDELDSESRERRLDNIPIGAATEREEIADLVVYLCSGRVPSLTGATITIDGGIDGQQFPGDLTV